MENIAEFGVGRTHRRWKITWQRLLPWLIPVALIGFWQLAVSAGWINSNL